MKNWQRAVRCHFGFRHLERKFDESCVKTTDMNLRFTIWHLAAVCQLHVQPLGSVVPNTAIFEFNFSVGIIRRKPTNRAAQ